MDAPAPYFHWGFVQISLPNLVVIGVMLLLFVLALVLPSRDTPTPMTVTANLNKHS
jgi:hypothetical protein